MPRPVEADKLTAKEYLRKLHRLVQGFDGLIRLWGGRRTDQLWFEIFNAYCEGRLVRESQLEAEVQALAKELDIPIQMRSDVALDSFACGARILIEGELEDGLIVWSRYRKHGDEGYRVDGAYRVHLQEHGGWLLEDGSSFVAEYFPHGNPKGLCVYRPCEGVMELRAAVYRGRPVRDLALAAVELGRRGGQAGGVARAKKLSPKRRSEISRQAANARWSKRRKP